MYVCVCVYICMYELTCVCVCVCVCEHRHPHPTVPSPQGGCRPYPTSSFATELASAPSTTLTVTRYFTLLHTNSLRTQLTTRGIHTLLHTNLVHITTHTYYTELASVPSTTVIATRCVCVFVCVSILYGGVVVCV